MDNHVLLTVIYMLCHTFSEMYMCTKIVKLQLVLYIYTYNKKYAIIKGFKLVYKIFHSVFMWKYTTTRFC